MSTYDAWLSTDRESELLVEQWEEWHESIAAREAYAEAVPDGESLFDCWLDSPDGLTAFEEWRHELP